MVSSGVSSRPAFGAAADDKQLALAGAGAVKIAVRGAGWVRVGQPALVAAGLDPSVDPGRLQLYADGVEQAIVVTGDGNNVFAADEAIEFWGAGRDTYWTDARTYWLVAGGIGARVATAAGGTATLGAATFVRTERLAERTIYLAAVRNGDDSNFFGAVVSATATVRTLAAHHLDAASGGRGRRARDPAGRDGDEPRGRRPFQRDPAWHLRARGPGTRHVLVSRPQRRRG